MVRQGRPKRKTPRIVLEVFNCQLTEEEQDIIDYMRNINLTKRSFFIEVVRFYMQRHPLQIVETKRHPLQIIEENEDINSDKNISGESEYGETPSQQKSKYRI